MHVLAKALGAFAIGVCPLSAMAAETLTFGPGSPNYNAVLNFAKYNGIDPLLGVKITVDLGVGGGDLSVDNDGEQPASTDVELGAKATISSGDVVILPAVPNTQVSTTASFNLTGDDGDGAGVQPGGTDYGTMVGNKASISQMTTITNPGFVATYVGAGTFAMNVAVDQILDFGGIGGVAGSFNPLTAGGSVTVEYIVPEPASLSLISLAGLGLLRRRK